jgi:hypothetical protein
MDLVVHFISYFILHFLRTGGGRRPGGAGAGGAEGEGVSDLRAAATALLREWILDNPFLQHDLRSRRRRRWLLVAVLLATLLPAIALGLLHLLLAHPVLGRALLRMGPAGMWVFGTVGVTHVLGLVPVLFLGFPLAAETRAERIEQLRLLPDPGRALLTRIAVARIAVRLLPVLAPLPLYLLAPLYGGVSHAQVLGHFFLLATLLFVAPQAAEVSLAFIPPLELLRRQQEAKKNPFGTLWFWGIMVVNQFLVRHLGAWIGALMSRLPAHALFPVFWFPFLGGFLVNERGWFRWTLAPLLPLLVLVLLFRVRSLRAAGDQWDCGPLHAGRGGGLDEFQERVQRRRRFDRAAACIALVLLIGLCFPYDTLGPRLGSLVGGTGPGEGLAALLLLVAGFRVLGQMEALRFGLYSEHKAPRAGDLAARLLGALLDGLVVTLACALLLGVLPGLALGRAIAGFIAAGTTALVFAAGWRRCFPPTYTPIQLPGARPALPTFLTLGVYLLPFSAWLMPHAALHYAATWSPIYGLARLLPGAWNPAPPVPVAAAILAPALAGLLLALARRAPRMAAEPAGGFVRLPEREGTLERWIGGLNRRWDNPLHTRALRLVTRSRRTLAQRSLIWLGLGLAGPAAFALFVAHTIARSGNGNLFAVLLQPMPGLEAPFAAGACLFAAAAMLIAAFTTPLMQAAGPSQGEPEQRTSFRSDLLLTPLPERTIVWGQALAWMLPALPTCGGLLVASLLWLLAGVGLGMAGWSALAWLGGAAALTAIALHLLLGAVRASMPWGVLEVGLHLLAMIGGLGTALWLAVTQRSPVPAIVGLAIAWGTVPLVAHLVARDVRRKRPPHNLKLRRRPAVTPPNTAA